MVVKKYYRRTNGDIIKSDKLDIILHGKQDIYIEGDNIDILNLTETKTISVNKILNGNNSLRASKKYDNTLIIYPSTGKKRVLKKVGTDNQGKPVLKFNDLWLRMSESMFKQLKLNYLHSLNKEYKELITINLDNYRLVFHSTRFGYPDITIYEKGQD